MKEKHVQYIRRILAAKKPAEIFHSREHFRNLSEGDIHTLK